MLQAALLAAIVVIGGVVRFWGLGFGLPHTQARPDETFLIDLARSFLRGDFFPTFYDYPWLYGWLLTGLYLGYYVWGRLFGFFHSIPDLLASWPVHWEPWFLIDRALSASAGTASILVVFWIGRRIWNVSTGLVAAFLLSVAFLHVRDSHFGTTDITMTMLVTVSAGLIVDAHLTRRPGRFALAGLVGGLAAATKYNALMLAAPIIASQVLAVIELPRQRLRTPLDARLVLFGAAFAAAFAIGVPFVFLDRERFLSAMEVLGGSMATGSPGLGLGNGWLHHLQFSLRYGLGLPFLIAGLAGAAAILIVEPAIGALLLSFPLAYYAAAGSIRNLFFRYAIPVVPFLCLTAAWLICRAARYIASSATSATSAFSRPRYAVVAAVLAVLIAAPSAISIWQFNRIISETDNRVMVARWFTEHVPPGHSVLQSGSSFGYVQLDGRMQYKFWVWDRSRRVFTYGGVPPVGPPDWILVQDSPIPGAIQDVVKDYLRQDYVLAQQFTALSLPDETRLYDRQDAFFVPFAGFHRVQRPGPNFLLYKRADVPAS
ncbi:MAG: glycosyltransferase family 39 protein [Acidobacteriota bacterium]